MQPHQQRVVEEESELASKIDKLSTFVVGDIYKGLPTPEQVRLMKQLSHMNQYKDILVERIKAFP